jgi:site-specific DNA-methyltransferase (adenine-specific)
MIVKEKIGGLFFDLIKGDTLIENENIKDGSVDLILTDLPYGTMEGQSDSGIYHQGKEKHEWDNIIPTDKIMEIANRILRKNGKMILFAQEPFTNKLMNNAIPSLPFNYRAIWLKDTLGSFMRSKKALLYKTEDILVFSKNHQKHDFKGMHPLRSYAKNIVDYIGLKQSEIQNKIQTGKIHFLGAEKSTQFSLLQNKVYDKLINVFNIDKVNEFKEFAELKKIDTEYRTDLLKQMNEQYPSTFNLWEGKKYKDNVFEFKRDRDNYHPTQKPVLLLEDLIKTFSNENNLVVDLTMGSGSTGVACKNTNRNFIGIEKDENYFNIAVNRIKGAEPNPNNFEKVEERGLFSFTDEQNKAD